MTRRRTAGAPAPLLATTLLAAVLATVLAAPTQPAVAQPVPAAPAQPPAGHGGRWVVTAQTAQGPVFRSVLAPGARAAMLRVAGSTSAEPDVRTVVDPGDPLRSRQWALERVSFERAWTVTRGEGVVVGVVDSGVDATHPDLAGQVLPGWTFTGAGFTSHAGQTDVAGHGTHVAGIVAARAGNGTGVSGAAPGARVLPVRVFDDEGAGWASDIANGIVWVANRGAKVINLSFGSAVPSPAIAAAVRHAQGRGALVVAAAGNEGPGGTRPYPVSLPGVLGVGAVDPGSGPAPFSTTGPMVDLAAPGQGVLSTVPRELDERRYARHSGTSMSSPYVAAAAALVRSAEPGLTAAQVAGRLTATAQDLRPAGRDDATGAGLVDPARALGLEAQATPAQLDAPTGLAAVELPDGAVQLSWTAVPGARSYEILLQGLPLSISTELGLPPLYVRRGTTARFPDFPRGTPIPLQVVAVDGRGLWGEPSKTHEVVVDARPVPTPVLRGASLGSRSVSLSWSRVRTPGLVGYGILRNGEPLTLVEDDELSFVDDEETSGEAAPVDGQRYEYRVLAVTSQGESDPSRAVVARSFRGYRTSAPRLTTRRVPGGIAVSWSPAVPGQLGWRVYVDGALTAQLPDEVRGTVVRRPGRHLVTVVRYANPGDQGPRATVEVRVPPRPRV